MVDQNRNNQDGFVIREYRADDDAEDLNREEYESRRTSIFRHKSMMPFVLAGAGFIVLVILLVTILSGSGEFVDTEQLQALESRIQQLEKKQAAAAKANQALERLAKQEQDINGLDERVSRLESAVATQLDQIIKELVTLKQKATQAPTSTPQPGQAIEKTPQTVPEVHQVRAGETLYRISRRYNLSVEQLRRYNNLGPNADIYPGQKLKLTPNGKQ